MKKSKKIIIGTFLLVIVVFSFAVIINYSNIFIIRQKDKKEQLATDDGVVTTREHLAKVTQLGTELSDFKTKIASAITDTGITTSEEADADTMASNIRSLSNSIPTLIWTNPNPNVTFGAQTVSLDLSSYNAIYVECKYFYSIDIGTYPYYTSKTYCAKGDTEYIVGYYQPNYNCVSRSVSMTDNGVTFGTGYNDGNAGNAGCIPVNIYGI